jgi:hypothetical protein
VLWDKAAQKLRGHYAYFGVRLNRKAGSFYMIASKLLYKWLNRRSQKRSLTEAEFFKKLRHRPLPKPWGKEAFDLTQGRFDYAV